jgi:cytochrome c551/c552
MMRPALTALLLAASQLTLAAEPPPSLTHYRCYVCHSDHEALVGPSFSNVAASYRGRVGAVAVIAGEIRNGIRGGGPWHMPPHPEVSPEESRAMAHYIMSLQPMPAPQEVKEVR